MVLRTEAVREVGGFDVRFAIIADWDLWLRIVARRTVLLRPVARRLHAASGQHAPDADRLLDELAANAREDRLDRGLPLPGGMLPADVAAACIRRASGRRLRPRCSYARLGYRARRTPRRAAGMLLGERLITLLRLRERTTVDPSLGQWLEPVREAERATTTGLPPLPGLQRDRAPQP